MLKSVVRHCMHEELFVKATENYQQNQGSRGPACSCSALSQELVSLTRSRRDPLRLIVCLGKAPCTNLCVSGAEKKTEFKRTRLSLNNCARRKKGDCQNQFIWHVHFDDTTSDPSARTKTLIETADSNSSSETYLNRPNFLSMFKGYPVWKSKN